MNIRKTYKIGREKAIELAMNHNAVSSEIAERYTDSELKEVLYHISNGARTFKFEANF